MVRISCGIRNLGDESVQSKLFGFSEATRGILQTLLGFAFLGIMGAATSTVFGFKAMLIVGAVITGIFLILGFIFLPKNDDKEAGAAEAADGEKYTMVDVIKIPAFGSLSSFSVALMPAGPLGTVI